MDGHTKWPKCNHEENNDISFTVHTHWPPLCRRPFGFPPNALITAVSAWEANEKKKRKLFQSYRLLINTKSTFSEWPTRALRQTTSTPTETTTTTKNPNRTAGKLLQLIWIDARISAATLSPSSLRRTQNEIFEVEKKNGGKNKSVQHWPFRPFTEPKPKKSSVFLPMLPFRTVSHWMCY